VIDETSLIWLALRERRGSIHNRSQFLKDPAVGNVPSSDASEA
jgi:hypothetical protein